MTIFGPRNLDSQDGFTIIELMVATGVLAFILLISTFIMISISNLYDKGINLSNIQDNTRNTIEEIAQDIQLSTGNYELGNSYAMAGYANPAQAFCIGDVRYTYVIGYALGTGQDPSRLPRIKHVFWRDIQSKATSSCQALNLDISNPGSSDPIPGNSKSGTELAGPNTRLTNLSVTQQSSGAYLIQLAEAFGDSGLINPNLPSRAPPASTDDPLCKTDIGDQYCATDALSLVVSARLSNGNN